LTYGQGEMAFIIKFDLLEESVFIVTYSQFPSSFYKAAPSTRSKIVSLFYSLVCDLPESERGKLEMERRRMRRSQSYETGFSEGSLLGSDKEASAVYKEGIVTMQGVMQKKYKPVAKKIKPIVAELPGRYRIIREIQGDPLGNIPVLEKKSTKVSSDWKIYGRT
jgi:hypothetical protein